MERVGDVGVGLCASPDGSHACAAQIWELMATFYVVIAS